MSLRSLLRSPLFILIAIFLLQWALLFSMREPTWDAVSYYAYARSVVFDQDLWFDNDYRLSYPTAGEHFAGKEFDKETTETGRVVSPFAIGSPLLWLPWLAVLRLFSLGSGVELTGYEWYFSGSINILSALIGFLAFWFGYKLAAGLAGKRLALLGTITLMFTTPLLFYQYREPMYSHASSAFSVALCVYVWWKQQKDFASPWQGLFLGGLIGFAALVRWQNITYLLLPLLSTAILWLKQPANEKKKKFTPAFFYLLLTGLAALAVFILQMSVWKLLYGSFLTIPQGGVYVDWRAPFLVPFLVSSFRGILPWMPVFFLAVIGLIGISKKQPQVSLPLILMLLLAIYVTASTRDWFGGGGYGPRRLTSELSILILGYTAFLALIPRRWQGWIAVPLGLLLALHQWLLLRFGLSRQIGGRVMSMSPTWKWEDMPLTQFSADLLALLPEVWANPIDFLVFPGSPLDAVLRQGVFPGQHIAILLATAVFLVLVYLGIKALAESEHRNKPLIILAGVALFLFLANLWVLNWA